MDKKWTGIPISAGIGTLISLAVTLAGSAIVSSLIMGQKIGEGSMVACSMLIKLLAAIIGSWCAVAISKQQRLQVALLSSAGYYLVLLATTALFFGGQYTGLGISALIVFAGCGLVILISGKKSGKRKWSKKSYR